MIQTDAPPGEGVDPTDSLMFVTSYLRTHRVLTCTQVAAMTCLLFNIIATFSLEVERIWKKKQSVHTILFYLLRYLPPLCLTVGIWGTQSYEISSRAGWCKAWWWIVSIIGVSMVQILAVALMLLKIWALYLFKKRVLAVLGIMLLGQVVLGIWGGIAYMRSVELTNPQDIIPVPGCLLQPPSSSQIYPLRISCVYSMLTTCIIVALLLNQCLARHARDRPFLGTWRDMIGIRTAWPVVHVLIRDGCLYFLIVLATELFLLIVLFMDGSILVFVAVPFAKVAYSVPATSMVLNLRDPLHAAREVDQREEGKTMSLMVFAPARELDLDTDTSGSDSEAMHATLAGDRDVQSDC